MKKLAFRWKTETSDRCTSTFISGVKSAIDDGYEEWRKSCVGREFALVNRIMGSSGKSLDSSKIKALTDSLFRFSRIVDAIVHSTFSRDAYYIDSELTLFGIKFSIDQLREHYFGRSKLFVSGGLVIVNWVPTTARLLLSDHAFDRLCKRATIQGSPTGRLLNRCLILMPIKKRKDLFAAYVCVGTTSYTQVGGSTTTIKPYNMFINYGYFAAQQMGMDLLARTHLLPGYFGTPEAKPGLIVPNKLTLGDTYANIEGPISIYVGYGDGKFTVVVPSDDEIVSSKRLNRGDLELDGVGRVDLSAALASNAM